MSVIIVSDSQFPNYRYRGSTAKVRIYYLRSFRSSENVNITGSAVGGNGWFLELDCTIDGSQNLNVPAFILYSTEDSNNPSARFCAVVYSQDGARRETIMGGSSGWIVPASPLSTTVALLEIAQGRGIVNPPLSYITRIATQALIDAAIGLLRFATSTIAGWVRLSVPADNPDDPVAYGANDPAVVTLTDTQVLSNKTLISPAIASFINAQHDHSDAAKGGALSIHLEDPVSVLTGVIDGINTDFEFSTAPIAVYLNQGLMYPDADYTIVGSTVTFIIPPVEGDKIRGLVQ